MSRKYLDPSKRAIQISLQLPPIILGRINRLATEMKLTRGELIIMLLDEWTAYKAKESKKPKSKKS